MNRTLLYWLAGIILFGVLAVVFHYFNASYLASSSVVEPAKEGRFVVVHNYNADRLSRLRAFWRDATMSDGCNCALRELLYTPLFVKRDWRRYERELMTQRRVEYYYKNQFRDQFSSLILTELPAIFVQSTPVVERGRASNEPELIQLVGPQELSQIQDVSELRERIESARRSVLFD